MYEMKKKTGESYILAHEHSVCTVCIVHGRNWGDYLQVYGQQLAFPTNNEHYCSKWNKNEFKWNKIIGTTSKKRNTELNVSKLEKTLYKTRFFITVQVSSAGVSKRALIIEP